MSDNSRCYLPKSEKEWKEKLELLRSHGFTRSWDWRYNEYPMIGIDKNESCHKVFGHYAKQTSHTWVTWEEMLQFAGIKEKEFPKLWYVHLNKEMGQILKKIKDSLPIYQDIQCLAYHGDKLNKYFSWDRNDCYYVTHKKEGWKEITFEEVLRFFLAPKEPVKVEQQFKSAGQKKRVTVTFFDDGSIRIGNDSYTKDK